MSTSQTRFENSPEFSVSSHDARSKKSKKCLSSTFASAPTTASAAVGFAMVTGNAAAALDGCGAVGAAAAGANVTSRSVVVCLRTTAVYHTLALAVYQMVARPRGMHAQADFPRSWIPHCSRTASHPGKFQVPGIDGGAIPQRGA